MLTSKDISGVYVMAPTPCVEGGEHWSNTSSVDLEESARMTENFVRDGVGGIAACGTTGECAALLWEEKRDFIATLVQVNRARVPIFAGATALGTKETVRQMRGLKDVGADGAFVGLPLWQTPTLENAVQFFADLGAAVPELPIMIYSNSWFFKSSFPPALWAGLAQRAPTVSCTKNAHGTAHYLEELEAVGDRIVLMPGEFHAFRCYELAGPRVTAIWSMTPLIVLAAPPRRRVFGSLSLKVRPP